MLTAVLAAGIFASSPAGAASLTWTGFSDGNWFNVGNWSPNQIPTSADDVVIDTNGVITLAGTTPAAFNSLTLGDPAGTMTPILKISGSFSGAGLLTIEPGAIFQQDSTAQLSLSGLTVVSGGLVTHTANSSSRSKIVNLSIAGNLNLQAGGNIVADGLGYAGGAGWKSSGNGPGGAPGSGSDGGAGGGHGGVGGTSSGQTGGAAYDSVTNPTDLGSGGSGAYQSASGGAGGGAILLNVGGTLSLNGTITANGANGVATPQNYGSGAGAGGTVNLNANALTGTGIVRANGGVGGAGGNTGGGGGAGGRVAIVAGTDSSNLSIQADAANGNGNSTAAGGAGVIARSNGGASYSLLVGDLISVPQAATPLPGASVTFDAVMLGNATVNFDSGSGVTINTLETDGTATVNNGAFAFAAGLEIKSGGTLMLNAASTTGGVLLVDGGGTFKQMSATQYAFSSVNVLPGGVMTHAANGSSRSSVLSLSVVNDFNLQAGATITTSGLGYAGGPGWKTNGSGPGGAFGAGSDGGAGGGHGGVGGTSGGQTGGAAYDSASNPVDLGSGGGGAYNGYAGGAGGGAVLLNIGGNLILNGLIAANGSNGAATPQNYGSGGGAGGTVNLTASAMSGTGSVQANGGTAGSGGNTGGGGGGGGRIAVVVAGTNSSALAIQANAGNGNGINGLNGGAGVIALKSGGDAAYSLSVGNLAQTPQAGSGVAGTTPSFLTVALNNGVLNFDGNSTVTINSLVVAGTAAISGGNFVFGSASPLVVQPSGSLQLTANRTTFPTNSPVEVRGVLAMSVGSNSGGALNVRSGGIFRQLNTQLLNFDSILVEANGVMTHGANTTSRNAVLNLSIAGNFDLRSGASILVNGDGYAGGVGWQQDGHGPGAGHGSGGDGGSGGGHGGVGGIAGSLSGGAGYDSVTNPTDLGSGGGGAYQSAVGGSGGGAVLLNVAGSLSLNGLIAANGATGGIGNDRGGGGGAGGTVNLTVTTLSGSGTVQANGGAGGPGNSPGGGGGAGGRIVFLVGGSDSSNLNVQAEAGATLGTNAATGGAGVFARNNGSGNFNLTIGDSATTAQSATPLSGATPSFAAVALNNGVISFDAGSTATISALTVSGAATLSKGNIVFLSGVEIKPSAQLMLNAESTSGGVLLVDGGGTFQQMSAAQFGFGSVNMLPGAVMTHAPNTTSRNSVLNLNVTGDFNLQAGASIAVSGLGYTGGQGWQQDGHGPGAGHGNGGDGGSGAGHGGVGGTAGSLAGGVVYDSTANPSDLGSGGGGAYQTAAGGAGGGVVLLTVGGNIFLNGVVAANGGNGAVGNDRGGGGGSGGTIDLTAAAISGTGSVQAKGGVGGPGNSPGGGGGGGGRVALTGCSSNSVAATIAPGATSGTNATGGAAGTVNVTVPPSCPSAPPAPAGLALLSSGETTLGQTFVTAAWSSAAQAVYYTLQASSAADFSGVQFSTSVYSTTGTIAGLSPNATYYLRVAAFNGIGASPYSASVSTLTPLDLTPPSAPTLLSAAGRPAGLVSLGWQAATAGEQTFFFNLYRATFSFASVSGLSPVLLRSAATSYVDSPSSDGIYYYAVTALDPSYNESGSSNILSAASIRSVNAAISDLSAVFSPLLKKVTLNWSAPSTGTAVSYNLYRSTYAAPLAGATLLQAGTTSTAFVDAPSLAVDATYFYLATSLNPVGAESAASNSASAVFDVHAPVIRISGIADGQSTNRNVTPAVSVTDFSPYVSTLTLNGQPFVSSTTIYSSPNQTVSEGGTASVSCAAGTIQSYTSIWATSCGNPTNCGTCPIGGTACSMTYSNSTCGDVAVGCSKDGRLTINCGYTTTLTQPGTYFLALQAQDAFANASSTTVSFTIDKASPTLTITYPPNGLLTNQPVTIVYLSTDDFSPTGSITVRDAQGHAPPFAFTQSGVYTSTLTATDLAGNQTASAVTFTLDTIAPGAISDLRATAVNIASGTVSLAWTVPSDNLTGVASELLLVAVDPAFSEIVSSRIITGPLTPGATGTYSVTVSTAQAAFLGIRSIDGAGNSSGVSNSILFNPLPPVITAVPAPGSALTRLATITAAASDAAGIASIVFSVDGSSVVEVSTTPFTFQWDTRLYADGAHTLMITATDDTGNVSYSTFSYTLSYTPPSPPTITSPGPGFAIKVATINVTGTAEPGVTVQLMANNLDLDTAAVVGGVWQITPETLIQQGNISLTAVAFESRGFSQPSNPVSGFYSSQAPQAPENTSATALPGGQSQIAWSKPSAGIDPAFYRIYRSTDDMALVAGSSIPAAASRVGDQITQLSFTDTPASDNLYFYAVTALDGVGNESVLSAAVYALTDRVAPSAQVLISTPAPLGVGVYQPSFSLSEVLSQPPIFTFTPSGGQPIALNVTAITPMLWQSTVTITQSFGDGTGRFAFQGTDLAGNVGSAISSATWPVITIGPLGSLALSKSSPLSVGPVTFALKLDEAAISTPTLNVTPIGGAAIPVPISATTPFDNKSWTGTLTISSGTGDGQVAISYSATDALGNINTALTGVTSFVILTTPPSAPQVPHAFPGSADKVQLSWSSPLSGLPAFYRIYRDGVLISTAAVSAADGSGSILDVPSQGDHQYQISAVDFAGNEGAFAAASATADATPPPPPINLTAALDEQGRIQLNWQSASTETATFNLYRTTYPIAGLDDLIPRNATPPFIDNPTEDAVYHYVVTALDADGNESDGSGEAVVTYNNGAPNVAISGVMNAAFYSTNVLPSFSIVDLTLDTNSVHVLLDGQNFVAGSTISAEGGHMFSISAANTAGHLSSATVSFTIDKTAPVIVFSVANGAAFVSTSSISVQVQANDLNLATSGFTLINQILGTNSAYHSGDPISRNGQYVLVGTARDLAGNVTISSVSFSLESAPAAPANLSVSIGAAAQVSWTSPEPDVVAYRVYRDGSRISASQYTSLLFVDAGFTPGQHVYQVSAIDANGIEGPKAQASVPAATLTLPSITLTRGFFDSLQPAVQNNTGSPLNVGPASLNLIDASGNTVASTTAPAVVAAAGQAASLLGVIATPAALSANSRLHVSVLLPTDPGATVYFTGDFALTAADPQLPIVEVTPNPLVPGTVSSVQLRFYNRGSAPMDVITAQVANSTFVSVNNVLVQLLTPQGTLLGQGGVLQADNGVSAILIGSQQFFFTSIPPNSSVAFDPISVTVPSSISSNLQVRAIISTPTYNLPFANLYGATGFSNSVNQPITQQVPYTATASPDKSFYDQGSTVTISGRSVDNNGFALANASVTVHVLSNGYDRQYSVVTDSSGNYSTLFFPASSEAGVYSLYAAHPVVVTHAAQSSFTIVGFNYQYSSFNASLSQNSNLKFTVYLKNYGATSLAGLVASTVALNGSGVVLTLDPATLPATLGPGEQATLGFTLSANAVSANASFALSITESHGFSRVLPLSASVVAAQAAPSVGPQSFQIGMLSGQTRTQLITLTNQGYATWQGVSLSSPTLDWVQIQGATNIGDIPPNGNASFILSFTPPASLPNGGYAQNPLIQVFSINAATIPINAAITVTTSLQGSVGFAVINADKPRDASGNGFPIPRAAVSLTNLDIAGLAFNMAADANGLAQFLNVPSGHYAWSVKQSGFQNKSGTMTIDPGVSKSTEVPMFTDTISYAWSVTPTTIADQYTINLNVTLKTDVPAPVLMVDKPMITSIQGHGQTTYAQYTLKNVGSVSAFNVALTPEVGEGIQIDLPFTTIAELKAGQSVVVPLRITTNSPPCAHGTIHHFGFYTCALGIPGQCKEVDISINAGLQCSPQLAAIPPLLITSVETEAGSLGTASVPVAFAASVGTLALLGSAIVENTTISVQPTCKCKPCKPYPAGTKCYGPLHPESHFPVDGPHYHFFTANQNPITCQCFWNSGTQDVIAPPPPAGWVDGSAMEPNSCPAFIPQ